MNPLSFLEQRTGKVYAHYLNRLEKHGKKIEGIGLPWKNKSLIPHSQAKYPTTTVT